MPRHKCRIAKPKPLNPKRRKKAVKGPELVSNCDHCGKAFSDKPLGRTYARTKNSAGVLAPSNGLVARKHHDVWFIFCNGHCALAHWKKACEAAI